MRMTRGDSVEAMKITAAAAAARRDQGTHRQPAGGEGTVKTRRGGKGTGDRQDEEETTPLE